MALIQSILSVFFISFLLSCTPAKFETVETDGGGKLTPSATTTTTPGSTTTTTTPSATTTTLGAGTTTTTPSTTTTTAPPSTTTTTLAPATTTTTKPPTTTTTTTPPVVTTTTKVPATTTTTKPPATTTTTKPPATTTTTKPPATTTTTTPPVVTTTTTKPPATTTTTLPPATTTTLKTTYPTTTTKTVSSQDNMLDILLIIDDSNSMLADNQKLAQKLQGFVTDLTSAGFDWQMCVTVTRAQQLTSSDPNLYWGASRFWKNNPTTPNYILKSGTANVGQIFQDTINQIGAGWAGTDDERAIKAAWQHLYNGEPSYSGASGCYRSNAGLSVIILSDEDERSVGGDCSQQYYTGECKTLESQDLPKTYVNYVRQVFGTSKRFNVNSIIVKPGDSACMKSQDSAGSKSHYGVKYNELSGLTNGGVGSICDSDYTTNLKYFKDQIVKDMASMPLECVPVGQVKVTISPIFATTTNVVGSVLYFTPKVPVGRTIYAEYECPLSTAAMKKANMVNVAGVTSKDGTVKQLENKRGIASVNGESSGLPSAEAGGIRSLSKTKKSSGKK